MFDSTKTLSGDPTEPLGITNSVPQIQENFIQQCPSYTGLDISYYSFQKCRYYDAPRIFVVNEGDGLGQYTVNVLIVVEDTQMIKPQQQSIL